jgi:hypothetical protein
MKNFGFFKYLILHSLLKQCKSLTSVITFPLLLVEYFFTIYKLSLNNDKLNLNSSLDPFLKHCFPCNAKFLAASFYRRKN